MLWEQRGGKSWVKDSGYFRKKEEHVQRHKGVWNMPIPEQPVIQDS